MPSKKELTVEQQIAQIEKEAQQKIKELRNKLTWQQRFKPVFDKFLTVNFSSICQSLDGHDPTNSGIENDINCFLSDVNLKVTYECATFDDDFYNKTQVTVEDFDLSEYPVYTVFAVHDLQDNLQGYIKVTCNYSSYNGNEYNSWSFVTPEIVTCRMFVAYKP